MYYYQSLQVADTGHSMTSKSISMCKYTKVIIDNSTYKLQRPPLAQIWGKMSSRQVKLLPTSRYVCLFTLILYIGSDNRQPCCVCKDEKASRDECMLFSNAKDPQKDCASTIDKYKSCMAGFGFQLP